MDGGWEVILGWKKVDGDGGFSDGLEVYLKVPAQSPRHKIWEGKIIKISSVKLSPVFYFSYF